MNLQPSIECAFQVPFRYNVYFTEGLFQTVNHLLQEILRMDNQGSDEKCLVFVEEAVLWGQPELPLQIQSYFDSNPLLAALVAPAVVLRGGENVKNDFAVMDQVHRLVAQFKLSRHSYVLAIGGGALLDAVGFAAATAHRGIRHIRIPTTTLSQADAGVGVKNGLNAYGKKNFIGTFVPPYAVINDFSFLDSLPSSARQAGHIEAVKVALIRDAGFFFEIEQSAGALIHSEPGAMRRLIRRCAELHVAQIANGGDPFEFGNARPLDFGHWSAHKLEQLSGFTLPHAEAVAVGMALDVLYSRNAGYLAGDAAKRILAVLDSLQFRNFAPELIMANASGKAAVLEGLDEFREHLGGEQTITLLREIGVGFEVHAMNEELILRAIDELKDRAASAPIS